MSCAFFGSPKNMPRNGSGWQAPEYSWLLRVLWRASCHSRRPPCTTPRRNENRGMLTRRSAMLLPLVAPLLTAPTNVSAAAKGEFKGRILAEWLPDNRKMQLAEPFEFISPDGRRWPVPAGTVVDGASIPKVFWSIIGGPFEGAYRGPSVVHDYYCVVRTRGFRDVHRMFHEAMLAAGVGDRRARLMFEAVDRFGPTWDDPKIDPKCEVVDENMISSAARATGANPVSANRASAARSCRGSPRRWLDQLTRGTFSSCAGPLISSIRHKPFFNSPFKQERHADASSADCVLFHVGGRPRRGC